jgi:hypothetical protein
VIKTGRSAPAPRRNHLDSLQRFFAQCVFSRLEQRAAAAFFKAIGFAVARFAWQLTDDKDGLAASTFDC